MKYFFCKLVPPRSTFAQDMTPGEADAMREHGVYWREKLRGGHVAVFGLVGDPKGAWGVVILEAEDDGALKALLNDDPAIRSGHGLRYEIYPMPLGATHA